MLHVWIFTLRRSVILKFYFFPRQAQHSPGPRASHRKAQGRTTTPASNRKRKAQHPHQRRTRKNGGTTQRSTPDPQRKQKPPRPRTQRPQTQQPQRGKPTQSGAAARATIHRPCTKTRAGPVQKRALYTGGHRSPKRRPHSLYGSPAQRLPCKRALHT